MSDTALGTDLQNLLEHSGWVRALARRLASGSDADEIEQATWLAALGSRAERKTPLREWLGAIARNSARQQRRARGRRAEHEQRAARGEALPATVDLLARAELQRRLVGAVMELDEPYRTAVLLRYFEQLPPRAIAARLGLPVATVHTHLARAIQRLRTRLDGEHGGDRNHWVAALAPLLPALDGPTPGLGALLMVKAKIVAVVVALSAVGAVTWWLTTPRPSLSQDVAEASERAARPAALPGGAATPSESSSDSARLAVAPAARSAPAGEVQAAAPVAGTLAITGRVLDASGRELRDARIEAREVNAGADGASAQGISAADGSFVIEDGPERGLLASAAAEFSTVLGSRFGPSTRDDLVVVLAPRLALAGVVLDEGGAPLPGARLTLEMPADLRTRFDVVMDHVQPLEWKAESGADGRFSLDDVPQVEGAQLVVVAAGFDTWRAPAPPYSDLALQVVLARPRSADGSVRGVVLDASGRPQAGAQVAFGVDTQRTADDGTFAFLIDDPSSFGRRVGVRATSLMALAEGWLPARFEAPLENGKPLWPAQVTLRLSGESLSISGRVVDAAGEPMPGVRVYAADASLFGAVDGQAALVETLFLPGDGLWKYVESDERGEFLLGGLLDRDYIVRAHDPLILLRVDSPPTAAGRTGLELRLPTDQVYPLVAGRILSQAGVPIQGASIHPMCDALRVKHAGRTISTAHGGVEGTLSDENGRFELRDVPMGLVYLRVDGENILPVEYGRYAEGDPRFADSVRELPREHIEDLEIRVEARCHMQVELDQPDLADELAVLNAEGRELTLSLYEAGGRNDTRRHPIHAGRSAMLAVPETGRTLVVFRAGVEVARTPIQLDPREPISIRL